MRQKIILQVVFHIQYLQVVKYNQTHKEDTMSQDLQKKKTTETEPRIHEILELSDRDFKTTTLIIMKNTEAKLRNFSM